MTQDEKVMLKCDLKDLHNLEKMASLLRTSKEWAKEKPDITVGYLRQPIILGNEIQTKFVLNIPAKAMAQIWEANKTDLELHIQRLKDLKNEETQSQN